MAAPAFRVTEPQAARLADPALREALLKFARHRLPPSEVDDLVQNTLADALSASNAPREDADFRRWVHGIARHKIADLYRLRGRLAPLSAEAASVADPGPATEELTQWIERELPKTEGAQATLHWLLRESEGETLDQIARDAALPAPRVRQRVSRLRRHFQTRWLALGAAGLVLLIAAGILLRAWRDTSSPQPSIAREVPLGAPSTAGSAPSSAPQPSASKPAASPSAKSALPVPLKSPQLSPKKSKAPLKRRRLQKPEPVQKQETLSNQAAGPVLKDLPAKSNADRKQLLPSKD